MDRSLPNLEGSSTLVKMKRDLHVCCLLAGMGAFFREATGRDGFLPNLMSKNLVCLWKSSITFGSAGFLI